MKKYVVPSLSGQARENPRRNRAALRTACLLLESLEQRRLLAAPVAAADNGQTHWVDEDGVLEVDAAHGVLANDTDADGDPLTAIKVTDPAHGTLVLNANGSYRYTPAADYFGLDTFTYKASDGADDSNVATVTLEVNNVNDAPVAVEDTYTASRNQTLIVSEANGLLKNDTDPDLIPSNPAGETLSAVTEFFEFEDLPDHGTLTLNADGSFSYAPATGYVGEDAFVYFAVDASGQGHGTTVTLDVRVAASGTQQPPTALGDAYATDEDTTLTVGVSQGVLENDTDPNGDPIVAILFTNPQHGTVTLNRNGSFEYTPSGDFTGFDFFEYRARDSSGTYSSRVAVTITLRPANDPPTLTTTTIQRTSGQPVSVRLDSIVRDPDIDDDLTFEILTQPSAGNVTIDDNGTPADPGDDRLVYTPPAGQDPASVSFNVRVTDEEGESAEGTITISTQAPPGGGSATLAANPFNSSKQDLMVQGTAGADVISVIDRGGGDFEVIINGVSKGEFSPTGTILVSALAGNDRVIATSVRRTLFIYGGVGNDVLRGGPSADVLIGGAGKDRLEGNGGRNILIGGDGRDQLISTSIGNILIGGITKYENPAATSHRRNLEEILSVWKDDSPLSSRVRGIKKGVGPLRGRFSVATIGDDQDKDTFSHAPGPDWLLRSPRDVIDGPLTSDRLMSI